MSNMTEEELAPVFAQEAYGMLGSKSKEKRIEKINENIKHTGYKAVSKHSNRDILTVDNGTHRFIAHRGTAFDDKKKAGSDISADISFALGQEHHNKAFKKRQKMTDKIIKDTSTDKKIVLTGHSYGGGSVSHSMEKKSIRDRVHSAHTYNPAISPFTKKVGKKVQKEIDNKLTHHRVVNDIVSASSTPSTGMVKTYQASTKKKWYKKMPKHLSNTFKSLDVLNNHSLDNFIEKKKK